MTIPERTDRVTLIKRCADVLLAINISELEWGPLAAVTAVLEAAMNPPRAASNNRSDSDFWLDRFADAWGSIESIEVYDLCQLVGVTMIAETALAAAKTPALRLVVV